MGDFCLRSYEEENKDNSTPIVINNYIYITVPKEKRKKNKAIKKFVAIGKENLGVYNKK